MTANVKRAARDLDVTVRAYGTECVGNARKRTAGNGDLGVYGTRNINAGRIGRLNGATADIDLIVDRSTKIHHVLSDQICALLYVDDQFTARTVRAIGTDRVGVSIVVKDHVAGKGHGGNLIGLGHREYGAKQVVNVASKGHRLACGNRKGIVACVVSQRGYCVGYHDLCIGRAAGDHYILINMNGLGNGMSAHQRDGHRGGVVLNSIDSRLQRSVIGIADLGNVRLCHVGVTVVGAARHCKRAIIEGVGCIRINTGSSQLTTFNHYRSVAVSSTGVIIGGVLVYRAAQIYLGGSAKSNVKIGARRYATIAVQQPLSVQRTAGYGSIVLGSITEQRTIGTSEGAAGNGSVLLAAGIGAEHSSIGITQNRSPFAATADKHARRCACAVINGKALAAGGGKRTAGNADHQHTLIGVREHTVSNVERTARNGDEHVCIGKCTLYVTDRIGNHTGSSICTGIVIHAERTLEAGYRYGALALVHVDNSTRITHMCEILCRIRGGKGACVNRQCNGTGFGEEHIVARGKFTTVNGHVRAGIIGNAKDALGSRKGARNSSSQLAASYIECIGNTIEGAALNIQS